MNWNYSQPPFHMYPPQQPVMLVQMPPQPVPSPSADRPVTRNELKQMKKAVKFYQGLIAEHEGKKKPGGDKKEEKKSFFSNFSPIQAFAMFTFLTPLVCLMYGYAALSFMQAVASMFK